MIMMNTDSPQSRTPFIKLNKKWKEFWKDSSKRKELLFVETVAATSLNAAVFKGNFFMQETSLPVASSFDQSGENLLRLLRGGSSKMAAHKQRHSTGSSFSRHLTLQRSRKLFGVDHSTSTTTATSRLPHSTSPLSHSSEFLSSSALTHSPKRSNAKPGVSLATCPSTGKSLLEILKQNKSSACQSNTVETKGADSILSDRISSVSTALSLPVPSTLSHCTSTDDEGAEQAEEDCNSSKKIVAQKKANDCQSKRKLSVGVQGTRKALLNSSSSSSGSLDGTSDTVGPQNHAPVKRASCKTWSSTHRPSSTQSSPRLSHSNTNRLLTSTLTKSNSSSYEYRSSSYCAISPSLLSNPLSLLVEPASSNSHQLSFSGARTKSFSTESITVSQLFHQSASLNRSCRQSDYKFANPLYMRSPEPDAIPLPFRNTSASTAAAT